MSKLFTVADLRPTLQTVYPELEDDRDNDGYDHHLAAVGLVLLSAAIIGTFETRELVLFTGYSRQFISAIRLNMQNNKLWIEGRYDVSTWLSPDGTIDQARFWDHIDCACGTLWQPTADSNFSADTCKVYWDERRSPSKAIQ